MAKKGSSPSWWLDHLLRLDQYSGRVSRIYQKYVDEFTRLATSVKVDPDRPFSFDDYPTTKGAVQKAMEKIVNEVTIEIDRATRAEWLESAFKNDKLVDQILLTSGLSRAQIENFYNHNLEALSSFLRRKDGSGLDLSDRVWRNTQQYKQEIELGIDAALGEGKSAAKLSQDVRGFLNEPEKLFRRIRDKRGNLHLSKNAKAYHPGRGVYRSSYRNAMRLAVSETNMAYKVSDQTRWEQLPIVVGYEIKISNNHPVRDICDDLKGKYPKTFKFKGWHPFCRCYVVSILISDEERDRLQQMILNGDDISGFSSALNVSDVPDGFKKWCVDNAERVKNWKSTPYWIRDNFKQGDLSKGLVQIKPKVTPPAPKPTPEPKKENPPVKPVKDYVSAKCPDGLKDYPQKIDHTFYDLIDTPPVITHKSKGSYQLNNTVNIDLGKRFQDSNVQQRKIIYHEVGHLIHQQRYGYKSQSVRETMENMRGILRKKTNGVPGYYEAKKRLERYDKLRWSVKNERLKQLTGFNKADLAEYCCATGDTLMSLNRNYGYGHTKSYFKEAYLQETEFLSHCFELYYDGNPVLKKVFPDLYEQMIQLVDKIISEVKSGTNKNRLWEVK